MVGSFKVQVQLQVFHDPEVALKEAGSNISRLQHIVEEAHELSILNV